MSEVDLGALDEFAGGAAVAKTVGDRKIVVVRIEDSVYVLDDRCSHEEFPLSLGEVDCDDRSIECERHGAIFNLENGEPLSFPATRPVPTYPVEVLGERVVVQLP